MAILSTIAGRAHPATGKRQIAGGVTEPSGDGATHAYLSKGHDRPVRGWHGLLLMRGGWSGIPPPGDAGGTGKNARGVTATLPVAGASPCLPIRFLDVVIDKLHTHAGFILKTVLTII